MGALSTRWVCWHVLYAPCCEMVPFFQKGLDIIDVVATSTSRRSHAESRVLFSGTVVSTKLVLKIRRSGCHDRNSNPNKSVVPQYGISR